MEIKRAREVLLSENLSLVEKVKAAEKLKKIMREKRNKASWQRCRLSKVI